MILDGAFSIPVSHIFLLVAMWKKGGSNTRGVLILVGDPLQVPGYFLLLFIFNKHYYFP